MTDAFGHRVHIKVERKDPVLLYICIIIGLVREVPCCIDPARRILLHIEVQFTIELCYVVSNRHDPTSHVEQVGVRPLSQKLFSALLY